MLLPNGLFGTRKQDIIGVSELGRDFVCCAENYAKWDFPAQPNLYLINWWRLIVDEMGIETSMKTIKPANVGGYAEFKIFRNLILQFVSISIAGGEKFIVHGILFKFCLDQQIGDGKAPLFMYGGRVPNDDLGESPLYFWL